MTVVVAHSSASAVPPPAKRTCDHPWVVLQPSSSRLPRKKRRCAPFPAAAVAVANPFPNSPRTVSPVPGNDHNSSNKRVRFSSDQDQVRVREVTTEDLHQSWLQEKDYGTYRQDCLFELRRYLRRGNDDQGRIERWGASLEQPCTRGLEILINRVAYGQATQRDVVRHIVHQYRWQKKHNRDDPPALRQLSLQFSQPDTIRARRLALTDQFDAKNYLACPDC